MIEALTLPVMASALKMPSSFDFSGSGLLILSMLPWNRGGRGIRPELRQMAQ
ncbi:hypothetical protein [Solimonas aquatica]|uniref:hypothetical protein n=1 Tax=Solimonas aquatica TaxID=489703 RepID=UPI0015A619B9|nr:hypothetical protein [Solimonas aquatica]